MSKPKSFTGAGCNTNFSTRWFVAALVLLTVIIAAVPAAQSTEASSGKYFVYVGTYTKKDSKGIYAYRFDAVTGETTPVGLVAETENPSFLAAHPGGRFLYAVNEIDKFNGQASGAVSAYSIDRKTGGLSLLNQVPSMGAGPAHLSLDKTGKYLLIANYGGGSVAAFPVAKDGWVGKPSGFVQHTGSSVNPDRQTSSHAHAIVVSNDNRFAVVADLGLDELLVYKFDAAKGSLTPNDPKFAKTDPGAGPRHLAFHPNNKFVYVVNEMQSTVSAFSYDGQAGKLHSLQRLSTLPKNYTGQNSTAEIWVDRNGKFLYLSNRGHDSIAVFAIDSGNGTLSPVEDVPTGGRTPRNFAIDPTGTWLFVANQESNNIVLFRVNPNTGRLTPAQQVLQTTAPVCISFVRASK
jgi:6-phosphogluconolactonase